MKERINWIDWAKALAVCTVVFCHLPQSQEWFYYRFLQATIITVFFWVSGYLKASSQGTACPIPWRKYWRGLILPYLLYNTIVYPYWMLRYYLLHGGMPDLPTALRPIAGALLLEHENAFCEPLNGPLWYLPAILIMHLLLDLSRKTNRLHLVMTSACIISFILYGLNNKYLFLPNLTPIGVLRGLPFYYLGYTMGTGRLLHRHQKHLMVTGIVMMGLGILCFHWHLTAYHNGAHWLHIALFYPVNLCFLLSVICCCKALDPYHSPVIRNLSVGTLVVIGLHAPLISLANFALEHLLRLQSAICYHWYEALPTALLIVALLYPVILFGKRRVPILLGKRPATRKASATSESAGLTCNAEPT